MKKKQWFSIICLIVCIVCISASVYHYRYARSFMNSITLVAQGESFDSDTIDQMVQPDQEDDEAYTAAAWCERKNQTVFADENQRSCQTDVIAIYGSSRCVLPYGKNLQPEQTDGCIISEKLAEELFASHQVEGQKINYAGNTWRICGVIEQPERIFLFEAADLPDEMQFDHISIAITDGTSKRLTAERFISRYGLSARLLRLDFYSGLSWLTEMIPTKWSDFDGWKQNWDEKKQDMQFVAGSEKSAIEVLYLQYVKASYCFAGIALLTFVTAVFYYRTKVRCRIPTDSSVIKEGIGFDD